jgi:adenosylmethionine-8-amino-7-oxononanoate aminotransferase
VHARLRRTAQELGLIVYPSGGTIDGLRGDHVLLAPSFLVTDDELALIVERLGEAIDRVCC